MVRRSQATVGPISRASQTVGAALVTAAIAGAIGGAAAGLIDGLWSWNALGQFVSGLGKLRAILYLAAGYALATACISVVVTVFAKGLTRASRLGDAIEVLGGLHRRAPAARLSLALAIPPSLAFTLAMAFLAMAPALETRKHVGLVIAVAMAATAIAIALGIILGFLFGRLIEAGLTRFGARAERVLSSPSAALAGLASAVGISGAILVWRAYSTIDLLELRSVTIACVIIVLVVAVRGPAVNMARALGTRRRSAAVVAIGFGILTFATLQLGDSDGPRKAATAHSGLAGPIAKSLRFAFDIDRDGYSRTLGGGDCDDGNAAVNPGAPEIPEDGLDNNCVGGDVKLTRDPNATRFATPPADLPADFNVILITIDTLRADHLGAYGYKRATSPTLDDIAASGTLFENAWAHAPSTRYSIPAILTGRHPLAVDYFPIGGAWPGIAASNATIAETLKSRGFETAAILNYWYFEKRRKMDQGFDSYDNRNRILHTNVRGEGPAKTSGSSSKEQTDKAIEYIEGAQNKRFFLWVHYYDPHFAYEKHPGTTEFGDGRVGLYDHEIRFTDDQIGRLVADLRSRGLYEKTVIVVTGDHGEGFGEHGIDLHGYHLYAAQTKIPLIVRVPGAAPSRVTTPAAHVDILPTLANLGGAEATKEMDGQSLVGRITGEFERDEDRTVFQQLSFENNNEMRAAASRGCHVIFNVSPHRSWETYEIDRDPGETRDVPSSAQCKPVRAALESFYDRSEIPGDAGAALLKARPKIAKPLNVDFVGSARLLAVELPAEIRRGTTAQITYTWEAQAGFTRPWKVFVHLSEVGAKKKKSAFIQADHKPARPFRWWKRGQIIRYSRPVTIPPGTKPGEYSVSLGLFLKDERHPVRDKNMLVGDKRAAVAKTRVVP